MIVLLLIIIAIAVIAVTPQGRDFLMDAGLVLLVGILGFVGSVGFYYFVKTIIERPL